jgi:glycosyltransferase involved in cell wall biosynthesis
MNEPISHMISIVIPNNNKGRFIKETLNSLLSQTYSNWEAIIIDDGSTDNSRELISEFAKADKRLRAVFQTKQLHGGSVCRNIGLKEAKGTYAMFLDSDDLLHPRCLELRHAVLEINKEVDFAVFTCGIFNEKIGDNLNKWIPNSKDALERFLGHDLPWNIMQPIYRTSFLNKANLSFPGNVSRLQDVFFHTNALLKKPKFVVSNADPDCFYRISNDRKTVSEFEFYNNWVDSVLLYINHFESIIDQSLYVELSRTAVYAIFELHNARVKGNLTKQQFILLSSMLIEQPRPTTSFRIAVKLLIILPYHVPGLRKMFLVLASVGI